MTEFRTWNELTLDLSAGTKLGLTLRPGRNIRESDPEVVFMTRFSLGLLAGMAAVAAPWVTDPAPAQVTFYKDVLPILQNKCQGCHRPGQLAPISFTTYRETRPWAEAMRTVVLSRKMPPWPATVAHVTLPSHRVLTQREIDTIVRWADQGAMEGDPKDAPQPLFPDEWALAVRR